MDDHWTVGASDVGRATSFGPSEPVSASPASRTCRRYRRHGLGRSRPSRAPLRPRRHPISPTFDPLSPVPLPCAMSTGPIHLPEDSRSPFSDSYHTTPDDRSAYSMATVRPPSPDSRSSLLSHNSSEQSYGATQPSQPSSRKLLWNATLKMGVIFVVSTIILGGTLWLALPTLEE